MTLLDRYILKQFLVNFIILFVVLFMFYCMVDLFLNLDRFLDAAERLYGEEAIGFWRVARLVFDFYGPQFFLIYTYLMGFTTIGAMGFTLVQLHRNQEMTAVIAAGVSLHRIVTPLILAGIALNVLQFANRELVLPALAPRLLRTHTFIGESEVSGWRVRLVSDSFNNVFYAGAYQAERDALEDLIVWDFDDSMRLDRVVTADEAIWNGAGWTLENGLERRPRPEETTGIVAPPRPIATLETDLDPTTLVLRRYGEYRQMLNLRQIGDLIEKPGIYDVDELVRIRYRRFAGFLTNILALLVTLPFFMLREPKALLPQAVKCSALGLTAQIGGAVGALIPLPGVPAAAGVFAIPLLILLPLAALMMSTVDT